MGLLKEIDEQICKPCRQNMEKPGEQIRVCCDETCALDCLFTQLDLFKIEGDLWQAIKLRDAL